MKMRIPAMALTILTAAPAVTGSAFAANEALISLSLADTIAISIAILFFVPLGVLFADRFVRGKTVAADPDTSVRLQQRPDAAREGYERYGQVISDLKRGALQVRRLAEGRLLSRSVSLPATETLLNDELSKSVKTSDGSILAKSRSEDRDDDRGGSGDVRATTSVGA